MTLQLPGVARGLRMLIASVALIGVVSACSDSNEGQSELVAAIVSDLPATVEAGTVLPIVVAVTDPAGNPQSGVAITFTVTSGGGSATPSSAVTDGQGKAAFDWTFGPAPVRNEIALGLFRSDFLYERYATLTTPYQPRPFGDVNAFLTELGIAGSTEDLAFSPDGERLLLGVPGGLIALDPQGNATQLPLSGDPIVNPLGIAFDRDGNLWVADSGADALLRVSPSGEVTTVLTSDGERPLAGPNYVAIGPDDRVYLSDPCLGELLRFDPKSGRVDAVLAFDLPSEGGPNGFAFDRTGKRLWLATENTGLLCGHSFVGITDPIASLFAIDVDDAGFTARETIVADFALFGDGVAFDAEGNLYVIFDTQKDFMLDESAIWVLPEGGAQLEKVAAVHDRVLANMAFGTEPFGAGTMYISLLSVPPFTPTTARGAEQLEIGIAGLPLLP
jgi:sugar lactone lactonase YvrE